MEPLKYTTNRLVKNEDLNHHGTLYAGRSAEWFVEAGFIAAAGLTRPEDIVCLKIHGMTFLRPVRGGDIVTFESSILLAGRSSLHAYVRMHIKGEQVMDGFITFIHVDGEGKAKPHGIVITPAADNDIGLRDRLREVLGRRGDG
jgi:acyl-CoA hydrolase